MVKTTLEGLERSWRLWVAVAGLVGVGFVAGEFTNRQRNLPARVDSVTDTAAVAVELARRNARTLDTLRSVIMGRDGILETLQRVERTTCLLANAQLPAADARVLECAR